MSEPNREERIRQRAFEIWERKGRLEGSQAEDWSQAEREIDEEFGNDADAVPSTSGAPLADDEGDPLQNPEFDEEADEPRVLPLRKAGPA
jgi:hypothetical protein